MFVAAFPAFLIASITTAFGAGSPCGLVGTVEQRIVSCNFSTGPGDEFQLVTRTQSGAEIYKGRRTGVIWSADLLGEKNYLRDNVKNICTFKHASFGGLDHLKWKLPPAQRFIQALKYRIQSSLPGMNVRHYWTSTADSFYVNSRYIFEGSMSYRQDSDGMYTFRHLEIEEGYAFVKCIVETI